MPHGAAWGLSGLFFAWRQGYGYRADTDNKIMAHAVVPHIANDLGVEKVFVGVKELKCMGAKAPFDHPHVYLDMGGDTQILCPYCSTLYVHDTRLHTEETDPKGCLVNFGSTG